MYCLPNLAPMRTPGPRLLALGGLLALAPLAAYWLTTETTLLVPLVTVGCVVVVVRSLRAMFAPAESADDVGH
jgi:fatty acid desaturase